MLAPLAAHIQSLKKRLLIIAVTLGVAFATAFAYSSDMVAWLNRPFPTNWCFYGPTEALFASIKVSFLAGIIPSLPVVFYQVWNLSNQRCSPKSNAGLFPVPAGRVALCAGPGLLQSRHPPLVIDFFVSFGMDRDITPALGVGTYIDFNVKFLLIFGCAFELPLVPHAAVEGWVVSAAALAHYRKHAIMAALIISAVVTPDATLFTMLLMAVPLMVLWTKSGSSGRRSSDGRRARHPT